MPILNYTTKIDFNKSIVEIQKILCQFGVKKIMTMYHNQIPNGLEFVLTINSNEVLFRLPVRPKGVLEKLKSDKKVPKNLKNMEQAMRVAWRILKDWVESQLALIESGLSCVEEVFTPYLVLLDNETIFQKISNNEIKGLLVN